MLCRKKIFIFLWTAGFFLFQSNAFAWGYVGHMLVAKVAYERLEPAAKKEVNRLDAILKLFYPSQTSFTTSAIWADWIKSDNIHAFDHWHYISIPYSPSHEEVNANAPENVVWAINQSISVLKSKRANDFEKALFLRFLVHFAGDVHQPMHCITLYNATWKEGDKGGNLYPIQSDFGNNLHALWDNGVGLFKSYDGKKKLTYFSKQIKQNYPARYYNQAIHNQNAEDWAKESHELAIQYAYSIPPNTVPTENYIQQGQAISQERIALAGYRLAYILNELFA